MLKQQGPKKCKMCNKRDKYIFSECPNLAQTKYKKCHNKAATLHLHLAPTAHISIMLQQTNKLWFTNNYAESMVSNLSNTGMKTEQSG